MNENPASLHASAKRAMAAGDFASARGILLQLLALDRRSIPAWLNLAAVCRQLNDTNAAFEALREVLRLEPRNFHALLMSATLLEREGDVKSAATLYGTVLANAPPEQYLDAATVQALRHAQNIHSKHTAELQDFIRARIEDFRSQCPASARRRLDSFVEITLRTRRRFQQEPLEYYYPGLPPIEFYERSEFPWLSELEASTPAMQEELAGILQDDEISFQPYIHYKDHLPLDQWRELNNSPRWSAYHFYEKGREIPDHCQRAPRTMQALAQLPQARVPLRSPSALFSVLAPKTRIPPHTGIANFRLVVHLPLILPRQCGLRVGGETREWRMGEAWVFDDTIEHEAWNESDQMRIIFIGDIWNPRIPEEEREAIARIVEATDAFGGTTPSVQPAQI